MTETLNITELFVEKIKSNFSTEFLGNDEFREDVSISVKPGKILDILEFCRTDSELNLTFLADLTAVDYLEIDNAPGRIAIVYILRNIETMDTVRLKAFTKGENPTIESAYKIWSSAEWMEREVWDLFGVKFLNHPNLKRILLPDDYTGYPLRKDYPLKGRGERDSFKIIKRERKRY